MKIYKVKNQKIGGSLLDSAINSLPVELHVPGYEFCGPGTKLEKRLKRGDKGINKLDSACREHDIAYSKYKSGAERRKADRILGEEAYKRFKSSDASIGERATALAVAGIMKAKSVLGCGLNGAKSSPVKKKKKSVKAKSARKSKQIFKKALKEAKNKIKKKPQKSLSDAVGVALNTAAAVVRKHKIPKKNLFDNMPRVIPVPKIGGFLPLVPVFAALSALGSLMGGAAGIAKAVKLTQNAKDDLKKLSTQNEGDMQAISIGKAKNGNGLYLKPYRKGFGLYIQPHDDQLTSKN